MTTMHQDLLLYVTKHRHVLVPSKEEGTTSALVVNRNTGDVSLEGLLWSMNMSGGLRKFCIGCIGYGVLGFSCAVRAFQFEALLPGVWYLFRVSRQDSERAIPSITDQEVTIPICGLLGFIQLLSGEYMIVITGRERVGSICGHDVYILTSFQLLPFAKYPLSGLSETQSDDEQRYVRLLENHLRMGGFYFSYSYDLTQSLQRQLHMKSQGYSGSLWERADDRFFWNRHASTKLINVSMGCDCEEQKQEFSKYILPMIQGFVSIECARINQKSFYFYLITRHSRYHSGTRFFSRGIDRQGHVANFNETEQIVFYPPKNNGADASCTQIVSYVQTRGSIPIYWGQIPDLNYTPKLWLAEIKKSTYAARTHFDEQIDVYGTQILVNLINKRGYELPLSKAYSEVVHRLNDPRLYYIHFDFNQECKRLRWGRIQVLVDQIQEYVIKQGYFYCQMPVPGSVATSLSSGSSCPSPSSVLCKEQTGVVRTSCIDCLDRTNVAQGTFARQVLKQQLRQLGILNSDENIESHEIFMHMYRKVWAENGDAISTAYSGTGALKTDYTRTGRRTALGTIVDLAKSLTRYMKNNFSDGARQNGFDLFLGNYEVPVDAVYSDYRSPFEINVPIRVRAAPYVLGVGGFMLTLNVVNPSHFGTQSWVTYTLLLSFWASVISTGVQFTLRHKDQFIDWPQLVPLPDYEKLGDIVEKGEMKPPDYGGPHKHHFAGNDQ